MCGFLGVLSPEPFAGVAIDPMRSRSQRLSTRGNTSRGEFIQGNAALFHYRLAFRDLNSGQQPMRDATNDRVLVFNGELYRFRDLRARVDYPFLTDSDTELLLGLWHTQEEAILSQLDGEYAFGIWEPRQNRLILGRDPYGIKPLFFACNGTFATQPFRHFQNSYAFTLRGMLAFASEMKGLPWNLRWDRRGFERQFLGLFEEIATPFAGVIQVPPGALLIAELRGSEWHCRIERKIVRRREGQLGEQKTSFSESAQELAALVRKSVADRLDADVPLGAYLSGGVDSRIVTQVMHDLGYEFPTFTVGFEGKDYDETAAVADFLRVRPRMRGQVLRTTNAALDYAYPHAIFASEIIQPYTNGSAKWWLSRFARRTVRGVLTGDGADEVFCGYPSYRYLHWWAFYQRRPTKWRQDVYAFYLADSGKKPWEAGLSNAADGNDLRQAEALWGWPFPLFAQVAAVAEMLLGKESATTWLKERRAELESWGALDEKSTPLQRWQNYFLQTNFPTHVLNWVGDRMEMANTLEGRPPMLSRAIMNWLRQQPDHFLVRGFREKAVLREAFAAELANFSRAPKKQFNAPFLLDSPLAQQYLAPEVFHRVGLISQDAFQEARAKLGSTNDPLQESFIRIFLQNTLVTHLLHETLVEGKDPERNWSWEDRFLDENTEVWA